LKGHVGESQPLDLASFPKGSGVEDSAPADSGAPSALSELSKQPKTKEFPPIKEDKNFPKLLQALAKEDSCSPIGLKAKEGESFLRNILEEFAESIDCQGAGDGDYDRAMSKLLPIVDKCQELEERLRKAEEKLRIAVEALEFIVNLERMTFAECTDAENIMSKAKDALSRISPPAL